MKKINNIFSFRLIVAVLLTWGIFTLLVWQDHGNLLNWDEIDYVNSTRLGVWANATEKGSLSPQEYIKFSLSKIRKSETEYILPENYSEDKDPFILRHYHPPFVNYLIAIVDNIFGSDNERIFRSVQLFGALVLIFAIYACYYQMSCRNTSGSGILIIGGLCIWMCTGLFKSLHFHGWQAVWIVFVSWFLTDWLNESKNKIGLIISLALSVLTLETGLFVVFFTFGIVLAYSYFQIKQTTWHQIAYGFILLVGLVAIGWSGAFLKISLIKIFGQYFYRFMFGQEYVGATQRFTDGIILLLPIFLMSLITLGFLIKKDKDQLKKWVVFFAIGWLYALVLLPVSISYTYLLPSAGPLIIFVGSSISVISNKWHKLSIVFLTILLIISLFTTKSHFSSVEDIKSRTDLEWLKGKLQNRESLIDGSQIYSFYLGENYLIYPLNVNYEGSRLLIRENGKFIPLENNRIKGKILIIQKTGRKFEENKEQIIPSGCQLYEGLTVWLYDCANYIPVDK